jgi:RNA polymerase sigma factor (sigma-70 family)
MALALRVTPPSAACSEHELVAAVRRGDDRAFEELYARYRRRIGSYVFGMVGDYGRAEDISQEIFISALRRLRDTERPIAFKPWIYEIAKNACIDHFRRGRRAEEVSLDAEDALENTDRRKLVLAATPHAAVENKQQLDDLRGAFGGLSESHHQVLVMRELEGLSYSQIGERLGMSRPVVESTLFRARKRLGEEYEELVSGRRCERVCQVVDAERQHTLEALGIRERRRLARHLSHCQPCRRHARLSGFDDSVLQTPGLAGRIAALLPIPWLRARLEHRDGNVVAHSGSHSLAITRSVDTATRFVDSIGPSLGTGRVAAAAAALAIVGAGGGLVTAGSGGPDHKASHPGAGSMTRTGSDRGGSSGAAHSSTANQGHGIGATAASATGAAAPGHSPQTNAGSSGAAGQDGSATGGVPGLGAVGGLLTNAGWGATASVGGTGWPAVKTSAVNGAITSTGRALNNVPSHLPGVATGLKGTGLPKVSLPSVSLPRASLPAVSLPKPALPAIPLPKVSLPSPSAIPLPTVPQLPPLPNLSTLVPPVPVVGKLLPNG